MGRRVDQLPSALDSLDEIERRLAGRGVALFLDYDGTLTPIVKRPQDALLPNETREVLRAISANCTVAIISGRDLADVRDLVGLDELFYAGSHGFDIQGPGGTRLEHDGGLRSLNALDDAQLQLERRLADVAGAAIERKRFAIAVHYRNSADRDVPGIQRAAQEVENLHEELRLTGGKKVFELRPDLDWDKGKAAQWLLEALGLDGEDVAPIYLGDDLTDEDAFAALADRGTGIIVDSPPHETEAAYRLRDTGEVLDFLVELKELVGSEQ